MSTINDFDAWLDCIDLSDYNDVYSLYRTVADGVSYSSFSLQTRETSNGNQYFLESTECDDALMLASEKAKAAFLNMIEKRYCGDLDIESYYAFRHAMEKDD